MKRKQNIWSVTLIAALFVIWIVQAKVALAAPTPRSQGESGATGEITGKILFEGTKPHLPQISMSQDPACVKEQHGKAVYPQDGQVNANDTLPYVFVYIKSGAQKYPAPRRAVTLDQRGCMYIPHVLGIMVGQRLKVVNSDFTTHNIHVVPRYNPQWNQSQPPGAAPFYKRFAHPEVMIPVHCNEHPWMRAYIGVVTNPFYDVTGKEGTFTIKDVPAGEYTLEAWTATFGTQEDKVTVHAHETTTADFTFRHE